MASKSWGKWERIDNEQMEGGQAHVFKVRDTTGQLPGVFALKRLKNDKRLDRFEQEIRLTSSIDSPYVSKIHHYDITSKEKFYVIDYYKKGSLEDAFNLRKEPLSFGEKVALCIDIATGLQVLQDHPKPIVHRDLKPDNIYLRDDGQSIVIGDFGLSYDEEGTRHTLSEEAAGSWHFMHPEFEDGGQIDVYPYHDYYSFGKVVYWIFSEGKHFSQQKHRLPKYDLTLLDNLKDNKANIGNYAMVNNLLDRLITLDTVNRHHHIDMIRSDLVKIQRVHMHNYHPLLDEPGAHTCDWCGLGKYYEAGSPSVFREPGVSISNPDYRKEFVCGTCGHVQIFFSAGGGLGKKWFKKNPTTETK